MHNLIKVIYILIIATVAAMAAPPSPNRVRCSAGREAGHPECCKWFDVREEIQDRLFNRSCGADVRKSIRIQWHDANAFSHTGGLKSGGGADGSILAHAIELAYPANVGLSDIVERQGALALKHSVSFGDFIQFASAVGLSNCEGAPRLTFLAGRPNASRAADDGLVPAPWHSADTLSARMADAGFAPHELVALLAGHSVATQQTVDASVAGTPLDSTPRTFDNAFFVETQARGTVCPGAALHKGEALSSSPHELRLQSDGALARDPRTAPTWKRFAEDQVEMARQFANAMAKLSVVGQDAASLVDCTDVVPRWRT
uniref:Peroxidase n=1 Tax=Phanerodontia chrysosporium TaxID=2822231 RepID=Q5XXE3_PHACH|nr:putative peroxidase [Phanerodontia chrysosporium]AAU82083.1 putative peroxidase [Phanerodontia chrysosporium]